MKKMTGTAVCLLALVGLYLVVVAGELELPGPPAPTMVTLQEIYDKVSGSPDTCFDDVGRFVVCGNGAVKDNLTGLFWLENANCFGLERWASASVAVAQLGHGQCGLTDDSSPGDWRLPTMEEWQVVLDQANANTCSDPSVPDVLGTGCCGTGTCPFSGVVSDFYWSSDTLAIGPSFAWGAGLVNGTSTTNLKAINQWAWPVRN